MEQNPPYTAPLNHPTPLTSNSFSPVLELVKRAWDKTQKQLLRLFLLTLIPLVGLVTVAIVGGIAMVALAAIGGSNALTPVVTVFFIALAIVFAILMLAINISTIYIVADTDPALSPLAIFKKSLKKVWPLMIASLLGGLIVLGGFVLLIIPGILFSILLSFSAYFVVMDNISPIEAMRKSVYVVSKNFGSIFIRLAVLFGIGFVAGLIINMLTSSAGDLTGSLVSLVFNLLFSWFSIAYTLSLFLEAKKTAGDGRGKLLWMVIVAIIGWILIAGGGYMVFRAAANNPALNTTPLQFDNTLLDLDELDEELLATPAASVRPASASASVRPTATPRASASPRASAATSSATR
jgi:flagellar basal body-associated protein FliL